MQFACSNYVFFFSVFLCDIRAVLDLYNIDCICMIPSSDVLIYILLCHYSDEMTLQVIPHVHFEADASELLENCEEMFSRYW